MIISIINSLTPSLSPYDSNHHFYPAVKGTAAYIFIVTIFVIIFQPPPPLMIEIIIGVNDENDGRPLTLIFFYIDIILYYKY